MRVSAAVLLVTAACSAIAPPHDATVSHAFTHEELVTLRGVSEEWDDLTGGTMSLDGGPWQILRVRPPNGYMGWTDGKAGIVMLAPGQDVVSFRRIARHELGHVRGLHHLLDPLSVMHANVVVDEFSRCDVVECMRVGACDHKFDFGDDECPEDEENR